MENLPGELVVICNGIPKSGTHALNKAVQLLGCVTDHGHFPYEEKPEWSHVLICRNPRNVVVSWVRFTKGQVTPGLLINAIKNYDGAPLFDSFARYEGYLSDPEALVVRFEDLIESPAEMQRIADYLSVPYIDGAFEALPGLTKTYTGDLSNWSDHWSDDVEAAWIEARGPEVEAIWKY